MLYITEPLHLAVTNQHRVGEQQAALVNSPFSPSFWGYKCSDPRLLLQLQVAFWVAECSAARPCNTTDLNEESSLFSNIFSGWQAIWLMQVHFPFLEPPTRSCLLVGCYWFLQLHVHRTKRFVTCLPLGSLVFPVASWSTLRETKHMPGNMSRPKGLPGLRVGKHCDRGL